MRELKITLTFKNRTNATVLVETYSYYVPAVGDGCVIKIPYYIRGNAQSFKSLHCIVYERVFMFEENRVVLIVNVI